MRTLAGLVVVAAVGFLWAHYGLKRTAGSPPALDRHAAVANFTLAFPSEWRVEGPRPDPHLSLADELTLVSSQVPGSRLLIGTSHPADPGALPPRLQATLVRPGTPQVVTLGNSGFYRYLDVTPTSGGGSESIYALPTTMGTVTAVCSTQSKGTAFTSNCERVLATVHMTSGSVLSLGVDPGYAFALNRILNQLNAVRRSAGGGLLAGDVKTRIQAASALAVAHDQAASAARHMRAVNVSAANQPLVAALNMNATAYRALARAAGGTDVAGYGRAEAALGAATRALGAAFAQLRRLGYQVR